MNIGVLGTGMVGAAIAAKLTQLGHKVKMGSRTADNAKAIEWAKSAGGNASHGTYSDAAAFGEILFNCTSGAGSLEALRLAGEKNINGKALIDISNPLDFSKGMPPTLFICNTDSMAEQIQKAFPKVRVVKALNMVNALVMVDPAKAGHPDMIICGNDDAAKKQVTDILKNWFGWKTVIDLGDITGARGMEMWLALWIRMWGTLQTPDFGLKIVRG